MKLKKIVDHYIDTTMIGGSSLVSIMTDTDGSINWKKIDEIKAEVYYLLWEDYAAGKISKMYAKKIVQNRTKQAYRTILALHAPVSVPGDLGYSRRKKSTNDYIKRCTKGTVGYTNEEGDEMGYVDADQEDEIIYQETIDMLQAIFDKTDVNLIQLLWFRSAQRDICNILNLSKGELYRRIRHIRDRIRNEYV